MSRKGKTTGEKDYYQTTIYPGTAAVGGMGRSKRRQKTEWTPANDGETVIVPRQAPNDLKIRLRAAAGLWRLEQKGTQARKERAAAMDKLILEALSKNWSKAEIGRAVMIDNIAVRIRDIDNKLSKE